MPDFGGINHQDYDQKDGWAKFLEIISTKAQNENIQKSLNVRNIFDSFYNFILDRNGMKNKLEVINKILEPTGRKITVSDLKGVNSDDKITNLKVAAEHLPAIRAQSSIRPSKVAMPLLSKTFGKI